MKIFTIMSLLTVGIMAGIAPAQASQSTSATVTVKFTLVEPTCTVTDSGPVDMGKHFATEFGGNGSKSSAVPFTITISNCAGAGDTSHVVFHGTQDTGSTADFKLDQGDGKASGLALHLMDDQGKTISPEGSTADFTPPESGDPNVTMNLSAAYVQTGTVTVGDATATLTYELVYD